MSGVARAEVEDKICTITIDNPDKRNALSPGMFADIKDAVETYDDDRVRVMILTGSGETAFSSGYDISEFEREEADRDTDIIRNTINGVRDFPYPTIAMVNGDVIGGAFELVCACDIRIGVPDARVGITPAKLGIIYEDIGINHIMDVVGPANTKELLFTANLLEADRGKEMGLFNYLVDREDLEDETYEMAEAIAGNAPLSLKGMKRITNAILEKQRFSDAEKRWVARLREEARESRDHQEAVEAFKEGRTPTFEGR